MDVGDRRGVHCALCGYLLDGLTPGSVCPECATPIGADNASVPLSQAEASRAVLAVRLLLASLILVVPGFIVLWLTMVLLPIDHPALLGWTAVWGVLEALGVAAWCGGWWLLSAPRRMGRPDDPAARVLTRMAVCSQAVLAVVVVTQNPVINPVYFQPLAVVALYPPMYFTLVLGLTHCVRVASRARSSVAPRCERVRIALWAASLLLLITLPFAAIHPLLFIIPGCTAVVALTAALVLWPMLLVRLVRDLRQSLPERSA